MRSERIVLGIDLGTRYALAAVHKDLEGAVLIPNRWGEVKTPSVVCFDRGKWLVGEEARRMVSRPDRRCWWDVKRHLGSDWYPSVGGRNRSAQEMLVPLISEIREDCEAFLGHVVTECVLTVPAQFSFLERSAAARAAREAGFEEVRILNEPTAAALFCESSGRILVFDFGGGTVDLSVVERDGDTWQVLESLGDSSVGGVELDKALLRYLADRLGVSFEEDDPMYGLLMVEAERLKCELSFREKLTWNPPLSLVGDQRELPLSRLDLERLFMPLIRKAIDLAVLLCRRHEPQSVVMVGGSSRIPVLRRMLSEEITIPVRMGRCPDEAVALGAAMYGVNGENRLLLDVLSESLGVIAFDGTPVPLLGKGHPLPARSDRAFRSVSDGDFRLRLYQGDHLSRRRCREIARLDLKGMKEGERVDLNFRIDPGGLLNVVLSREFGDSIHIAPMELGVTSRKGEDKLSLSSLEIRIARLSPGLSPEQQDKINEAFRKVSLMRDLEPLLYEDGIGELARMTSALEDVIMG
ncbi:MAG: Hsp70 family protein [Synergistota bacterium]|nr:Hsp70 family protein [Synergistota bacterium]